MLRGTVSEELRTHPSILYFLSLLFITYMPHVPGQIIGLYMLQFSD